MSELISCLALVVFTRFVSGHGMVHGDPDNKKARKVALPKHVVANFADEGLIVAPKIDDDDDAPPANADAEALKAARENYAAVAGKKPYAGWSLDELLQKTTALAEAKAQAEADAAKAAAEAASQDGDGSEQNSDGEGSQAGNEGPPA